VVERAGWRLDASASAALRFVSRYFHKGLTVLFNAVVSGVVLLGLVIFVHELGHFLMAKWRGVRVLRFSLGFGPALFAFRRGETEYRICWFPLGGYVSMAGDHPAEDGTMPARPDEFLSHSWLGRLLIAAAGPAANLATATLVMIAVGMIGVSYPDFPNRLGATPDTSTAYAAGLRAGDRIVSLDGTPIASWVPIFVRNSQISPASPVTLGIERDGRRFEIQVPASGREPFFSSLRRVSDPPVVGAVVTGMPAYKAGLKEGDRILAVDGQAIATWDDLPRAIGGRTDHPLTLTVRRDGQEFGITVTPINADGGSGANGRIGIEAPRHGVYVERHGFLESVEMGVRGTGLLIGSVYGGMWLTVSRPLYYREYLGGPLFIAQAAGEQARRGLDSYLQFLAMINIAIMAFNLLPIPILDGGHILLSLLQAVRHRAISTRAYVRFQKAGLVVIGVLFIFILANDPLRLIQRQRALDRAPRSVSPETTIAPSPP